MRKIIMIATLFCFSFLLKDEKALSKSKCKISCNKTEEASSLYPELTSEISNSLKPYDGFFIKI